MDHDKQMAREYSRQETIRKAISVIDKIIMEDSDRSEERTNDLTGECAISLLICAIMSDRLPFYSATGNKAIRAAQKAIVKHEEKAKEVQGYLFVEIAKEFVNRAIIPFQSNLLRWEMDNPA